jgi:hypothetical protein
VDRFFEDPLASVDGRFPLAMPTGTPPHPAPPSPVGLRPWGLRRMRPISVPAPRGSARS